MKKCILKSWKSHGTGTLINNFHDFVYNYDNNKYCNLLYKCSDFF